MTSIDLQTLRKRADFLRLNRGRRFASPSFVLQSAKMPDEVSLDTRLEGSARLGLTVTKKIGNAVIRNKTRRRLREAARQVMPIAAQPGYDYVLIARATTGKASFDEIKADLVRGLKSVHKPKKQARK